MTAEQFTGYVLLCLMIGLVYLATRFVCDARYKNKGIYYITINAWFRGNKEYRSWLKYHKIYHWCILLIVGLCPTILLLIHPFSEGRMLMRPENSIYVNVLLWTGILLSYRWFFKQKYA